LKTFYTFRAEIVKNVLYNLEKYNGMIDYGMLSVSHGKVNICEVLEISPLFSLLQASD